MKRKLLWTLGVLMTLIAVFLIWFYMSYGGSGRAFPRLADPKPAVQAEIVATLPEPPGNIAVSETGRIFFTYHAESRPEIKVLELVNGKPVPYPNRAMQTPDPDKPSYGAVFNLRIDSKDRLWSIDHGDHGVKGARLVAVDIKTDKPIKQIKLPGSVAGIGSYVQDMQIDPAGRYIYLADIGVFNGRPGLIIVDSESGKARRVLDSHKALMAEPYQVNAQGRIMKPLHSNLFWFHPAFDPIALDRRNEWLYVGPMAGKTLYRVRVGDLHDKKLNAAELSRRVERYAARPQVDGITIDNEDRIYLTGIEDGVIWMLDQDKRLSSLAGHPKMRWPDGLSFGPDNWVYIADSNIPDVMMRSKAHIASTAPFYIFRFKAPGSAPAGQ
ncbi:MAG: L-dopachrome tautomerase-related protein [Sphingorhabdus sp.]